MSLSGCAVENKEYKVSSIKSQYSFTGLASWYSAGSRTASGEPFRAMGVSVAHRTLPFGTRLRLTNLVNNSSIVARVNDRGPFVYSRVLDVSKGAAIQLGFLGAGQTRLKVEILD